MNTPPPLGTNHPIHGSTPVDATALNPDHELSFATDHEAGDLLEKSENILRLKAMIDSSIHQPSSSPISEAVKGLAELNHKLEG